MLLHYARAKVMRITLSVELPACAHGNIIVLFLEKYLVNSRVGNNEDDNHYLSGLHKARYKWASPLLLILIGKSLFSAS